MGEDRVLRLMLHFRHVTNHPEPARKRHHLPNEAISWPSARPVPGDETPWEAWFWKPNRDPDALWKSDWTLQANIKESLVTGYCSSCGPDVLAPMRDMGPKHQMPAPEL